MDGKANITRLIFRKKKYLRSTGLFMITNTFAFSPQDSRFSEKNK